MGAVVLREQLNFLQRVGEKDTCENTEKDSSCKVSAVDGKVLTKKNVGLQAVHRGE